MSNCRGKSSPNLRNSPSRKEKWSLGSLSLSLSLSLICLHSLIANCTQGYSCFIWQPDNWSSCFFFGSFLNRFFVGWGLVKQVHSCSIAVAVDSRQSNLHLVLLLLVHYYYHTAATNHVIAFLSITTTNVTVKTTTTSKEKHKSQTGYKKTAF